MISVIVPVYNAANYLDECLNSIVNQTMFSELEVIIVDDCSSDESLQICQKYAAKYANLTVLENDVNLGQAATYMRGIQESRGEFVGFIDSDDWIDPAMFNSLYREIVTNGADIAACGCFHVRGAEIEIEGSDISGIVSHVWSNDEIRQAFFDPYRGINTVFLSLRLYRWNKIFRRSLLLQNTKYIDFSIRVFEDNNLVIPCLLDAAKIAYLAEPLYYYRRHSGSTMTQVEDPYIAENERFIQNLRVIYEEKHVSHDFSGDLITVVSYSFVRIFQTSAHLMKKKHYLAELHESMIRLGISRDAIDVYSANWRLKIGLKLTLTGRLLELCCIERLYTAARKVGISKLRERSSRMTVPTD